MKKKLLFILSLAIAACGGHPKSPAELEAGLESSDAVVRRDSADGLRDGGKVPADAVPKLLIAASSEKNPDALGAMLVTLGASGAGAAHDPICMHDGDANPTVAKAADRAIGLWLKQNLDQGGCNMSGLAEVPKDEGPTEAPTEVPTKPVKKKSWTHELR